MTTREVIDHFETQVAIAKALGRNPPCHNGVTDRLCCGSIKYRW